MGDAGGKFREIWKGLEPKGQLTLVGAVVGTIAVFYLLFSVASRPSYSTLLTGVDPSETADVTKALDGAGIAYELSNGGTQVDVQSGEKSQAEVALASKGLPKGAHVGFEIFDKQSLGQTQFQQQVDYQRALEGEIARTVEQIDGISSAQVQLVLPQESIFADAGSKASASILVDAPQQLDSATVSGIAHLVAGSVKGLSTDRVTITDSAGTLLWPNGDANSFSAATKLRAEAQYGSELSTAINAMLASTLGPGKAQARVHADLNVDQTSIQKVTYAKKGTPLRNARDQETLQAQNGGATTPAAGTASNLPSYASGAAGAGGTSNYKHTVDNTQFGVDRTEEKTTVAPGSVNELDVALLLDKSVPAAQVKSIQDSVASMAGLDPKRGDTITVSRFAFAKPAAAPAPPAKTSPLSGPMLGYAKYVAVGLGALIFLFLMRRGLRRREGEAIAAEPVWLREIETAMPVAELEPPATKAALQAAQERRNMVREEIEQIVQREPEQVAAQIGQWLKE